MHWRDQILLFSHTFLPKSTHVGGPRPPLTGPRPPTGNPGSTTDMTMFLGPLSQVPSSKFLMQGRAAISTKEMSLLCPTPEETFMVSRNNGWRTIVGGPLNHCLNCKLFFSVVTQHCIGATIHKVTAFARGCD